VGGIGDANEDELTGFLTRHSKKNKKALGNAASNAVEEVVLVYSTTERQRQFAFVELKSIELTTACMGAWGSSSSASQ
jgi:hypothetical protein